MNFEYQHNINFADHKAITSKDCFNALTEEQKRMVENSTTILKFKKGETIIKQGYVASHILYIEKGLAKLDVVNDSKISTVRLLSDDSFIGIACSFACQILDFSAVAMEDTIVRMINMEVFIRLIKENGEFALKLVRHISTGTSSMVHWMSRLSKKNVEGSLAMILQEFSEIYSSSNYTLPVTRVGLSSLAGCSKESVINALTQFHNDGIIELDGKNIKIINSQSLNLIIKNG